MLKGVDDLGRRLDAIVGSVDDMGDDWGDAALHGAQAAIPVRTGETRDSLRVEHGVDGVRLVGNKAAVILDRGARAHDISSNSKTLRWEQGLTVHFAKKVHKPPQPARPYLSDVAHEALDDVGTDRIVDAWNRAA